MPVPALLDTLEFLSDEIKEGLGVDVAFPVDVQGAEYLFFPAVSDYIMEADTLMGNAAVFRATGDSWTIGTGYFDGINYGLFYNDQILEHVVKKVHAEAERLQVKKLLIGECGHASRTAKVFYPTFCGEKQARPVVNIMEYTHKAWRDGKLKLKPNVITERVTYHDPCNFARSGWIVEQPRELLKAICSDYVEMTPNRRDNICCGGGGGTVSMDELRPYRTLVGGKAKAEQIRATGAKYCVAPCANCKKQLKELMEDQGIDCQIVGLHDLFTRRSTSNQGTPVESWIEFGRGPLFRIAFSLMLLGLLRSVVLTAIGIAEAYRQSPDKIVNWREVRRQTLAWLFPVTRLWRSGQPTARFLSCFMSGCSWFLHSYLRMSCYGSALPGLHGSPCHSPWQTTSPRSSL